MNSLLNFFLIMTSISLTANTCNRETIQMDKIIDIYWQHSYEDDKGDTLVFRPKDYDFPPSRGREGFEFKGKGVFHRYVIAPADGINTIYGSWKKLEGENTISIEMNENMDYNYPVPEDYKIHILEFHEKERVLKIKYEEANPDN